MGNKDKKQQAQLRQWFRVNKGLAGFVYDHPKFEDGTAITTSKIESFDLVNKRAVTQNTIYYLGEPMKKSG